MDRIHNFYSRIKQFVIYASKNLSLPVWSWLLISYTITVMIAAIDYATIEQISFTAFYLIPVFIVVWFVGDKNAFIISVVIALTWLISDHAEHIYASNLILYWNVIIRFCFFIIFVILLSALKSALKQEESLSRIDFITGVANSRYFYELANLEIDRAKRYIRYFTVIYIDIDNFKSINDRYGHNIGDTLLHEVANTIHNNLRTTDIVARVGGDEFVVLLPEAGTESAGETAHKLNKKLLNVMRNIGWDVTFSLGVVTFLKPPASVNEMIKMADTVMYSAKNNGKNMVKYETYR